MTEIAVWRTADAVPVEDYGLAETDRPPETGLYLLADGSGLSLCKSGEKGRVRAEFAEGAAQHRRTQGGGELIARAVNHTACPSVWDATGGLGRDAFVLASLGLHVKVFERHPAVAALFSDGLRRAAADPDAAAAAARIELVYADAAAYMDTAQDRPDVVYLDPMYPVRRKSAAVKKEMAYFHELVGAAEAGDEAALLAAARRCAKKRVVVKRPRLGDCLAGEPPAYHYGGKSTRFDVYLPFFPQQDN
ncbi:class I SAM-dependent methyltransferase [Neisseria leonii]|uniref:Ribosomal RNA small subunit methyltransferase J n=1 Tax=Neisseria leonii TaxID=2995413 RepID=A0A9X4E1T6_9NEIS|nr:class I SAM-dependent methyltransferase [Neisseria sp. 51.81]MDD9327933.1 class I SAM-dependent methyltransferase [Neisseria sp. 51.81]